MPSGKSQQSFLPSAASLHAGHNRCVASSSHLSFQHLLREPLRPRLEGLAARRWPSHVVHLCRYAPKQYHLRPAFPLPFALLHAAGLCQSIVLLILTDIPIAAGGAGLDQFALSSSAVLSFPELFTLSSESKHPAQNPDGIKCSQRSTHQYTYSQRFGRLSEVPKSS